MSRIAAVAEADALDVFPCLAGCGPAPHAFAVPGAAPAPPNAENAIDDDPPAELNKETPAE